MAMLALSLGMPDRALPQAVAGPQEIQVVITAALGEVAAIVASERARGRFAPWEIVIPDSSSAWRSARSTLYPLLHGRPRLPTDSVAHLLRFEPIVIRRDSLFARFATGSYSFCRRSAADTTGHWISNRLTHQISATRRDGAWRRAVPGQAIFADAWCLRLSDTTERHLVPRP